MLTVLGLLLVFLILCFGFVLLFGAPYLPTLTKQATIALDMIDLQPGQTLLELGCGDGKILVAAARRGWKVTGYELNPLLVLVCLWRTRHYRKLVRVRWGNFWTQTWPTTDGIFVFVMQRQMHKLDTKITESATKPLKLVSFAFTVPGKKAVQQRDGVYLYNYK
jgi:SAM-dependent methyltransferase